jgi:uncharacterized membrane protein YdbT with pleckstrin-like domain
MSYLKKHLMSGEVIEREARLHWIIFVPAAIFIALAILLFSVVRSGGEATADMMPVPVIFLVIGLLAALSAYVNRDSSEFAVTNKRVVVKTGWLSRRSTEILLRQVEGITVNQGIIGRMFDYGTIIVEGTGTDHTPYTRISEPMQFRLAVQEQIERNASAASITAPPILSSPPAALIKNDPYDTLLKLNELKEKGILTEDEFKAEKRKILG